MRVKSAGIAVSVFATMVASRSSLGRDSDGVQATNNMSRRMRYKVSFFIGFLI
jgi:hypothetical protein